MKKFIIAVFAFLSASCVTLNAQQVDWGNLGFNPFADEGGTNLAVGEIVRIGTFSISTSQIQANANNLSFLDANFTEYGSSTIGTNPGSTPGTWLQTSTGSTAGLAGSQIFVWAFNGYDGADLGTTTEHGVFFRDMAANSSWAFPADNALAATSISMADMTDAGNTNLLDPASVVLGSFNTTSDKFELAAVVPEPTSGALLLVGGAALMALRRRRTAKQS